MSTKTIYGPLFTLFCYFCSFNRMVLIWILPSNCKIYLFFCFYFFSIFLFIYGHDFPKTKQLMNCVVKVESGFVVWFMSKHNSLFIIQGHIALQCLSVENNNLQHWGIFISSLHHNTLTLLKEAPLKRAGTWCYILWITLKHRQMLHECYEDTGEMDRSLQCRLCSDIHINIPLIMKPCTVLAMYSQWCALCAEWILELTVSESVPGPV